MGTRPISAANVSRLSNTEVSVPGWPMTSPMFESQTPMAKCRARNFCGRSTKPASALGGRVEVLVVNTVRAGACAGRLAPERFLDGQATRARTR